MDFTQFILVVISILLFVFVFGLGVLVGKKNHQQIEAEFENLKIKYNALVDKLNIND